MKAGYSHCTIVLDNSGSMSILKEQTIAGFNNFIEQQKKDPGTMTFSLYQFRTTFGSNQVIKTSFATGNNGIGIISTYHTPYSAKCVYNFIDIKNVPPLNNENYICETLTPLLDAMGTAIDETGKALAALPESERPSKVFIVTLTDGFENASVDYNHEKLMSMIKHQQEVYQWEFIYLGANQDAIAVGGSMGVHAASSMSFSMDPRSIQASYNGTSAGITRSKLSGMGFSYTDAERAAALGDNETTKAQTT